MSHFPVLVIGENVEALLAPYHEFECTGLDDQYVQSIDETEERRREYENDKNKGGDTFVEWCLDYYGWDGNRILVGPNVQPNPADGAKYGWMRLTADRSDVVEIIRRSNPNKKWDWWVVGGRWSNMLLLTDGRSVNSAPKRLVDWATIRDTDAREAGELYDKIHQIVQGRTYEHWDAVLARYGKDQIEEARSFYHQQDVIRAMNTEHARETIGWVHDFDQWMRPRDVVVTEAAESAGVTHAVITKDGTWHERGEMGWFAMVHDEKPTATWEAEFGEMIDALDDTDLLTIVDCHI